MQGCGSGCGVLVDPIYTLAAWQVSCQLAMGASVGGARKEREEGPYASHGGSLGLFAVAQRFPKAFVDDCSDLQTR